MSTFADFPPSAGTRPSYLYTCLPLSSYRALPNVDIMATSICHRTPPETRSRCAPVLPSSCYPRLLSSSRVGRAFCSSLSSTMRFSCQHPSSFVPFHAPSAYSPRSERRRAHIMCLALPGVTRTNSSVHLLSMMPCSIRSPDLTRAEEMPCAHALRWSPPGPPHSYTHREAMSCGPLGLKFCRPTRVVHDPPSSSCFRT